MSPPKILVTGTGAVCAAGMDPAAILGVLASGRTAVGPIRQWDTSGWPVHEAGEVADFNPRALVDDRKLHKLIRRTDLFGLYAAGRAIDGSGVVVHRDALAAEAAATYSDRTGVYVGSGGGNYQNQYDYFPLLTEAHGDLPTFGRELASTVNPMWLLRTLPNNVLGHIGIRHGLKGPNACITNHSVGGTLAVIEAAEALRNGEADRAVAVGHDAPIEPQMVLYYQRMGLVASGALLPFDARHDGSVFGEGAGALMLETEASAAGRGATVLGEILGGGYACEAEGLVAIRDDGDGVARAIAAALDDAQLQAADVGMIVAHGNGTRQSDVSEAAAIRTIFGDERQAPPVTGFKWAFGHLIAAAGIVDTVVALAALARHQVPGIATLSRLDPACAGLNASATPQAPRSNVALIICRGFAGTNAALLVRAA
jgi:3-oxoacyl-[acyl-carrier-protein] synthase-1